jgi:histone H3/H4
MAKKKAKAKAKTKKKSSKKTMDMLLVGSKTKDGIRAAGCNVAGDALDALNGVVHWYIQQASARAQANGRKTVRGHDFCIM